MVASKYTSNQAILEVMEQKGSIESLESHFIKLIENIH